MFSLYSSDGRLLLNKGYVITDMMQWENLVARGGYYKPEEDPGKLTHIEVRVAPQSVYVGGNSFEHTCGLISNLKFVFGTALKKPEQINVPERILHIALAVQEICKADLDSALAAPIIDFQSPLIVVHQVFGAVLTEIIALSKGFTVEQRLPLICAALTRDFGQITMQGELDSHAGRLPEPLWKRMCHHPLQSVNLLQRAGVTDSVWLDAVLAHHERLNGGGYPSRLKDEQISIGAQILAVADVYCALVKPRVNRKAFMPQNAFKELLRMKDEGIDAGLVRILMTKIGVLPPATIVRLKSGETAVVKSPTLNANAAIVYSIYGPLGEYLSEPLRRDASQPNFAVLGVVEFSKCQAAAFIIKRVWTKIKK